MRYLVAAYTDAGILKEINQDSFVVRRAEYAGGEILMAAVCDGMGGLSKGELASAVVIREFDRWFDEKLPSALTLHDIRVVAADWVHMLEVLNIKLGRYGGSNNCQLGTTFTGMLFIGGEYIAVHVGDTRAYRIDTSIRQLTEDQTFVAREVRNGNMTEQQAKNDSRRNILLQCVGACESVTPQVLFGRGEEGGYMLCSDGFRHNVSEEEMYTAFSAAFNSGKEAMNTALCDVAGLVKARGERDNITALLIKAMQGENDD